MNYVLAFIVLALGIACLIWHKTLLRLNAEFMAKRFKAKYGGLATKMRWDDPKRWQSLGCRLGMIGVGLFFIAWAYILAFGTIHIGTNYTNLPI
jgi:hypothetical protein